MRPCPFCAEEIQDAAIVCKHCGRDLKAAAAPPETINQPPAAAAQSKAGIGCAVVLLLFLGWCGYVAMTQPDTPESSVADLQASVQFTGTQFAITNKGPHAWRNIECDLNGGTFSSGFLYRFDALAAGETATVGALQFANSEGVRFNPIAMKPNKMMVKATLPTGQVGMYFGSWK